ncbi:MAG: hypothetical protein AABZ74_15235, partial [Cyanobacteriota bacterium]
PQALLADPTDSTTANDSTIQLFAYNTNNINSNNITVLGFKDKASGLFKGVYSIARLASGDLQKAVTNKSSLGLFTKALGGNFSNISTQYGGATSPLKSAKVENNMITIELNPLAFDKDDRVILSAGVINGKYDDKINSVFVPSLNSVLPSNEGNFMLITDPSGRPLDSGNALTSANIDINNSQRVATAN